MAIRNPDTLYTGGNVAFDSTPSLVFYRQIEAERRAKQDAIDDYMRGLRGKVTPAGMATNDIDAFDHMRKKWQEFGVQNREKMARDPRLRAQFDAMANDLISFTERSKAKMESGKPFIGMISNRANADKIRKEAMEMYDKHMMPLMKKTDTGFDWDYDRKDIDYTSKIFQDPKFDFQKEFKGAVGEIKPSVKVELENPYTDKQTGMIFFPKIERYDKEQASQIGRNFMRNVLDDEDKLDYYSFRMAQTNLDEYQKLDNVYKSHFGEPIGKDRNSPAKFAAAEAIVAAEQSGRSLDPVSKLDYERRQADKINNIIINKMPAGSQTTQTFQGNEFDRIAKNLGIGEGTTGVIKTEYSGIPEQTKAILKSAGIDVSGIEYFMTDIKNGEIQSITPYWTDKEGKLHKEGVITRQDMENAQLKYNTEPQKGKQPVYGTQQQKSTPNGMVTVVLKDGRKGEIPANKVSQFLKDNPGAKKQ